MKSKSKGMSLGVATAVLAGALLGGGAATADDGLILSPSADRPAETLVRERCQRCHGMEGLSAKPYYPKLAGQNADYLTRQLANFKTGVRKNRKMEDKVADLSGGEMLALAEYFSRKPLVPEIKSDPGLVEIGRRVYFHGNPDTGVTACVECHGPQGRGAMYLPRLAGQHAEYIENQIRAFLDQSRTSPDMVMHSVVANMSEKEIGAAAHFLSTMK